MIFQHFVFTGLQPTAKRMSQNSGKKPAIDWGMHISRFCVWSSALVSAGIGVLLLCSTSGIGRMFKWIMSLSDPLLEIKNPTFLLVFGIAHLVFAGVFVLPRASLFRGILGGWLGANHLVYYLGLLWMKAAAPYPFVRAVAMELGTPPKTVEIGWKILIAFLLTSSIAFVLIERQRIKAIKDAAYDAQWRDYLGEVVIEKVKRKKGGKESDSTTADNGSSLSTELKVACPNCGQHFRHETSYAGNEITCPACMKSIKLFGAEDLKISCFFCEGHIQFPAHALGRKMPCPHCHKDITLIEPK